MSDEDTGIREVLPDYLVDVARRVMDNLFYGETPSLAASQALAMYVLQRKAGEYRTEDLISLPQEKTFIVNLLHPCSTTRCPSCNEMAPVFLTKAMNPPIFGFRCSRGHYWEGQGHL